MNDHAAVLSNNILPAQTMVLWASKRWECIFTDACVVSLVGHILNVEAMIVPV